MSWLIRVFIENTRMSHFFSCHCQSLSLSLRCFYLFFYVIARLDRAIYFFSPALNIITCTLNVIAPAFSPLSLPTSLSVITRLDRVISLPLLPIFRMPRSSRSMTGWSDNYSTFLLFLPLFLIFFSFGHYPNIIFSLPLSPTSSSQLSLPDLIG